jgi:hypothetical protein
MAENIQITVDGKKVTARLNESSTARAFFQGLPMKISMSRWGDEYYGDCGLDVQLEDDARAEMEVGELAIWPQGCALCLFFGPTPASIDEEPRAISPVNPIGQIECDTAFLKKLPSSISIQVDALR